MGERFWIILLVLLPAVAASAFLTFRKPTIYTAIATVEVLRSSPLVLPVQDVVNRDIRNVEDLNTLVRRLESRPLVERVAKRIAGDDLRRFSAPYESGPQAGPVNLVGILSGNRRISTQRGTLVIAIAYNHANPAVAAKVANLFAEEFISFQSNARTEDSLQAVENLKTRLEEQRQKVHALQLQLQNYKEDNATVSLDQGKDIVTEKLKQLNAFVAQASARLSDLKISWELVQRYREQGRPLTEISFIAQQPAISSLQQQLAAQEIQLAQLEKRYRHGHPRMIEALNTFAQTKTEGAEAIRSTIAKLESDYLAAGRALEVARADYTAQEQEAFKLDRLAVEYGTLQRELLVNEQAHDRILARMNETTMSASIDTQNTQLVDRAAPPTKPSSPDHPADLAFGVAAGVSLAVGIAFLVALLDDRVKGPDDVEAALDAPLLGLIPTAARARRPASGSVGAGVADRRTDNAIHALHSRLRLNPATRDARVILVTSANPREGRTFLASQLARACAAQGERTLLLDADLRNPALHHRYGVKNDRGVTDLATRPDSPLESLVHSNLNPNLDLLTAGRGATGPTQVLGSRAFARLAREAREKYDRVIIDAPALGDVSDALMLHRHVDGCLFTLRYSRSRRAAARKMARRWREGDAPVLGVIVNRVTRFAAGYFYAQHEDAGPSASELRESRRAGSVQAAPRQS